MKRCISELKLPTRVTNGIFRLCIIKRIERPRTIEEVEALIILYGKEEFSKILNFGNWSWRVLSDSLEKLKANNQTISDSEDLDFTRYEVLSHELSSIVQKAIFSKDSEIEDLKRQIEKYKKTFSDRLRV